MVNNIKFNLIMTNISQVSKSLLTVALHATAI